MNNNVIVITGPTASGKTDFALKIAEYTDIEVISADSRQVYRYMDIGTAKPSAVELAGVKHHLIDILNPDEEFSAGRFAEVSISIINDIKNRGKIPVLVGGTGFYIKALFEGLSDIEDDESEARLKIREELNLEFEKFGKDYLYGILSADDPIAANKYSDKNPRRVIRALEYFRLTGNKFSDTFGMETGSGYNPQYYVLKPNREDLYNRINKRSEMMFEKGLIREVAQILEMGYPPMLNSLNTVGYKECISMIYGEIPLERAIELTKQNTRRYAKRQYTWLNQIKSYDVISNTTPGKIKSMIEKYSI
ncbi:MAG: tRNA (adenosine(37)-N6)-dimethylallyltransferase MiaA [Candidatus Kapabacteria bacterium]|nr:tRNA (adenosine(37)-N6)-dimethylallyltransferase MiaA [Ignavibacteriota bacterium]MCW5885962.1 tRNA (adenosine(37)-N6)-dimethylallyltransferase MiaA [Candidatus Kapabacteria bacterium]